MYHYLTDQGTSSTTTWSTTSTYSTVNPRWYYYIPSVGFSEKSYKWNEDTLKLDKVVKEVEEEI
jgi:hypothetical protein